MQMLSALACDRLVDGYLKTSRPPPQFLLRYEQILKAKVIDVSHAGLTDYHVAPLLALLQRSCGVLCCCSLAWQAELQAVTWTGLSRRKES